MRKMISGLNVVVLLSCLFSPGVFAQGFSDWSMGSAAFTPNFLVKDNSGKDSATRTGTENWEQPQMDFFIVPAVIIGVVTIVLFWKRD